MRPMLATRGSHVPTGGEWRHEVKWDSMRIIADCARRPTRTRAGVRLTSRNENDVSISFPELQGLAGRDLLLDREVVAGTSHSWRLPVQSVVLCHSAFSP